MTELTAQEFEDRFFEVLCMAGAGEVVIVRSDDRRVIILPARPEDGPMFKSIMGEALAQFGEAFSYERMLDVATMADVIAQNFPSRPAAYWWLETAKLEQFEEQTPLQMLMEGRYEALLRHIRNIMALSEADDIDAGSFAGQQDVQGWLRNVIIPAYVAYSTPGPLGILEAVAEDDALHAPNNAEFTADELAEIDRRLAEPDQNFVAADDVTVVIRGSKGYRAALTEMDALWSAAEDSPEGRRLALLVRLVVDYEESRWPSWLLSGVVRQAKEALQGRYDENLIDRLGEPLTIRAFVGWRSATAAAEACQRLFSGDIVATIKWMNHKITWSDFTPVQLAEKDDEGLQMVLDHIGRIDAGVYF